MYRTFVILRHTFKEAVYQPIYSVLLILGAAVLFVYGYPVIGAMPFFTLGEDTVMYKALALDIVLLFTLVATLFATSRSIFEEIEDRTMLTLMSKPIKRWEVLIGKYLGIITASLLAIVILGAVAAACMWLRIPEDYRFTTYTLDDQQLKKTFDVRRMHLIGLGFSLAMVWMQVSVLAAIGVALSTRFSLVVNLPAVILIYFAGNLTRFMFPLDPADSIVKKGFAWVASAVLPYLAVFDLRELTVYRAIKLTGTQFASIPDAVTPGTIANAVGLAALYAVAYITFALAAGLFSFRTRELGGSEG